MTLCQKVNGLIEKLNSEILMVYQLKIKKLRPYLYSKLINMFKNLLNMLLKIFI